ncbi:hypothetical protein FOY51_14240 [Antrihabitans cavernicola]|uniref:Uncharacterized protein n=1 Tax=Antrihabitans cavernicola TaxID=2495913 RepID=A0A5A7S8Y0_9NOCA|nr:hypothetical protein FOY51_14240 [Spelaeibacter cavernicola]
MFGLPFDTGHLLALRVFPQNPFAPYATVWHRDPTGRWSLYVDGPRLDTACPRYYGDTFDHVAHVRITLTWIGPWTLRITLDEPGLEWTVVASQTAMLRLCNAIGAAAPLWTWRPRLLISAREALARGLGMGRLRLATEMPSGHHGILMPERMFYVDRSHAVLDGVDFGRATRLTTNPELGGVPLPARGVMVVGQGMWQIADRAEYERTRAETAISY